MSEVKDKYIIICYEDVIFKGSEEELNKSLEKWGITLECRDILSDTCKGKALKAMATLPLSTNDVQYNMLASKVESGRIKVIEYFDCCFQKVKSIVLIISNNVVHFEQKWIATNGYNISKEKYWVGYGIDFRSMELDDKDLIGI